MVSATLLVYFALTISAAILALQFRYREAIVPGVYVESISVGGLNRQEALNFLQRRLYSGPDYDVLVFMSPDGRTWQVNYDDIHYDHKYEAALDQAFELSEKLRGFSNLPTLFQIMRDGTGFKLEADFDRTALLERLEHIKEDFDHPPQGRLSDTSLQMDLEATMSRVERRRLPGQRVLIETN